MFSCLRSPPHIVYITVVFKTLEYLELCIVLLKQKQGVRRIRTSKGCRRVEVMKSHDDPYTIVVRQEWDSSKDEEAGPKLENDIIDGFSAFIEGNVIVERFSQSMVQ